MSLSILLIVVIILSCSTTKETKNNKFTIVTSFYPLYIATLNITSGIAGVEVINMTPPQTGCLHDYSLTTTDLKTIERANVFVVNGVGMESFTDKVRAQYPKLPVLQASKDIKLLRDPSNGEDNPHVWVSISGCIAQLDNIMNGLMAVDPVHASLYKKNGDIYRGKLEALRQKMHTSLKNISAKDIVTFHEAFPYFAQELHLTIVAVIEREPGSEPSPKELISLIQKIKKLPSKILFVEPQYSAKSADLLSRDTGASIYILDPAVSGDGSLDSYLDIMKKNLQTLVKALS